MKATLKNIEATINGYEITFVVGRPDYKPINKADEYELKVSKWHDKRTTQQNAYYWSLLRDLANKHDLALPVMHNRMLSWYGAYMEKDGMIIHILRPDDDSYQYLEEEHLEPTYETEVRNGITYRWFRVLLPSHLMDSQQIAKLIDGVHWELYEKHITG